MYILTDQAILIFNIEPKMITIYLFIIIHDLEATKTRVLERAVSLLVCLCLFPSESNIVSEKVEKKSFLNGYYCTFLPFCYKLTNNWKFSSFIIICLQEKVARGDNLIHTATALVILSTSHYCSLNILPPFGTKDRVASVYLK